MAEARSQIAFEELGLGQILDRYRLKVPANQREYSWRDREFSRLFQDFARAINEEGPYFLGTIVTIPRGEGLLEVVDGQQRLATTAILLAAIRDYLRTLNEDILVQSIDQQFLSAIHRESREQVPKLTLNADDNQLFNRIIVNTPGSPIPEVSRASHERLLAAQKAAKRHVQSIVSALAKNQHGNELNRWISFIEYRAVAVLLKVPNDVDAFKMFETLNDRGLRTSQVDLIKNFLFAKAGSRLTEVQSRWSYMRGALESASDDSEITINFLRHALIAQEGHLREVDIYETVEKVVRSEAAAATFSATLETLSNVYVATLNPDHERWNNYPPAARRSMEVLNLLDIKPLRPLILAIANRMDPSQAANAFQLLIALGVRLNIASSTRSSSVEVPLAEAARDVFHGKIDTAPKLRQALLPITPTDLEFQTAFETARVSSAKLARYYLRSLERNAKTEPDPWFLPEDNPQVINLEHVLPKKPDSNWAGIDEAFVRVYASRLGNQALMRAKDNADLKSSAFAVKRLIYSNSPYVLTKQIADAEEWNDATINERQKRLAELAIKTWSMKL